MLLNNSRNRGNMAKFISETYLATASLILLSILVRDQASQLIMAIHEQKNFLVCLRESVLIIYRAIK